MRNRRRRTTGLVLIGLGVFCMVLGLMARYYAYPNLVLIPLDRYEVTESRAENATYFDPATLTERRDRTLVAIHTIRGNVRAATPRVAVWESFDFMRDADGGKHVGYARSTVAMDRRTGEAVNCCGQSIETDRDVQRSGLAFKWPFYTEKTTYQYYDETLRKSLPISYDGTERLFGVTVYRFTQQIEPTQLDTQDVPGSLVGEPDTPTVHATRWYQNSRTFWVEPRSGAIVKAAEDRAQTLRNPAGQDVVTLFRGNVVLSDSDVRRVVREARIGSLQIAVIHTGALWTGLVLGLLLVVAGLALRLRRPERERASEADQPAVTAPVP